MLTHSEAQALISASLDQPLDPDIEDVLAEHLATCDECRYFAASSQRLASALTSWPSMPASPTVRQGVWDAISTPLPWWQRVGGAFGGQTAAIVSTAAVALLVIALATLAFVRLNDDGSGDDDPARLAAGTSESIAQATETPIATETAISATETPPPTSTTAAIAATEPPAPTETTVPPTATTVGPTNAPAATEPAETPTDLTGDNATSAETATEEPADLTSTEAPPSATSGAQPALAQVTEESSSPATPVPPTATPEPTSTPEPSATPEPTATPSPEPTETPVPAPADFTVALQDANGAPIPDACWALLQDGETITSTCDTPDVESEEFASNGRIGFFEIPSGTYTLRLIDAPDGITVEDRTVEIAPGSNNVETITATVSTPVPEPTNPPESTSTPQPTNTPEPTAAATEAPADLTDAETDIAADGTPADVATAEETSPPIVPADGEPVESSGNESGAPGATSTLPPATGSGPSQTTISPADATRTAGEPVATQPQVIEPTGGDTQPAPTSEATAGDGTGATAPPESGGYDLADAPIPYEAWDDINLRLTFEDGAIVFTAAPNAVSLDGPRVEQQTEGNSTWLAVCDGDCVPATQDSGDGSYTDSPIGWIDGQLIYQRESSAGEIELRSLSWAGEPAGDSQIGSAQTLVHPYGDAYRGDAGVLIPTPEGWLLVSNGDATVVDGNPFGEPSLVRTNFTSSWIAYVSGGQLIIAEQSAPGTPLATIPFSGVDYDLSPEADRVAISTGQGLEIWSLDGTMLGASGSQITTGSLVWLGDGIYIIDIDNQAIRLVPPDALT